LFYLNFSFSWKKFQVILDKLNSNQRAAATHGKGPVLVLAGAGSGKTRVITYRIANLINSGVAADKILALSFTNKAAKEVAERVRGLIGKETAEGLTVSTFHSLGNRILRQEGKRIGLKPGFGIHGEGEQRAILKGILRETGTPYDLSEIQQEISLWKNRGLTPDDVRASAGGTSNVWLQKIYASYQGMLRASNAVDFDDLLLIPLTLFRHEADCLSYWRECFAYILVDEYQDTNPVQFELLKLLAAPENNLCAVGDDDQSIYGWRGADVRLILDFHKHFPGARIVTLEENYRSTQTILDGAHAVVSKINGRRPKKLRTGRGPGYPLGFMEAEDASGEADEVTSAILAERYRKKRPWKDFAVLLRTNAQTRPFEESLRRFSIPYRIVGGSKFFDRKEVRDVISYLKLMNNPSDDASLVRIANVPRRGLGPKTLLKIREKADAMGVSLRQALGEVEGVAPQASAGVKSLFHLLDKYGRKFRLEGLTSEGLREFIKESGLRAEVEAAYDSPLVVRRRLELLEELCESVAEAPKINSKAELGLYIEKMALDPPSEKESESGDEVTVMTLHSAKGLEFPVVFMAGMEEGLLPHVPAGSLASEANLDEERRLCYVGMTRAKERLYLCRSRTRRRRGVPTASAPSRFLADVPIELTESGGSPVEKSEEEEKAMAKNFFSGMRDMLE